MPNTLANIKQSGNHPQHASTVPSSFARTINPFVLESVKKNIVINVVSIRLTNRLIIHNIQQHC